MAESMNLVALDWVRGEIEETLNQTQEALEGYIENPEDVTRLQFCVTYLHQVVGTLKMIEAHGASLLSEEMEHLAQAIADKKVSDEKDAIEVLLRAVLQMPQYLARIFSGGRDMAVVLLPLLNEIRAVKGEALLSESSLFTPDIETGQQELEKSTLEKKEDFSKVTMRKIRQLYEISLLGIIKDQELDKNIRYMSLSLTKLANMTVGTPTGTLWWISQALMDSIRDKGLECTKAVKMLLGKLNIQMRVLLRQESSDIDMPAELLKNILFYIAKSSTSSTRIESVRQAFRLQDTVLSEEVVEEERGRLAGPDRAAMTSVVNALLEQVDGIKETLDAFVAGKVDDIKQLAPVTETLKQISDTLSVVGVTSIKSTIADQHAVLKNAIDSGAVPERSVMVEVAGGLLHAESTLKGLLTGGVDKLVEDGAPERLSEAQELVVKECRTTLEAVKESFNTYVKSYLNVSCIEETPAQLREVMGALSVMEERRSAAILDQSCAYVENELISAKKKPEARDLEALADAISAVEYYLEQIMSNGRGDPLLLEVGEERMQWVGYEVPGTVGAFGELKR